MSESGDLLLDSPQAWREFLHQWSQHEISQMPEWEREDHGLVEGVWQGEDPATQEEIAAAESRLGVRFPADYRAFLLCSNGWDSVSAWTQMYPVSEVQWMRDALPGWAQNFREEYELDHWADLVNRALYIGDGGDGSHWVMDPPTDGQAGTVYVWWMGDGEDPEPFASLSLAVEDDRNV